MEGLFQTSIKFVIYYLCDSEILSLMRSDTNAWLCKAELGNHTELVSANPTYTTTWQTIIGHRKILNINSETGLAVNWLTEFNLYIESK